MSVARQRSGLTNGAAAIAPRDEARPAKKAPRERRGGEELTQVAANGVGPNQCLLHNQAVVPDFLHWPPETSVGNRLDTGTALAFRLAFGRWMQVPAKCRRSTCIQSVSPTLSSGRRRDKI